MTPRKLKLEITINEPKKGQKIREHVAEICYHGHIKWDKTCLGIAPHKKAKWPLRQ